MRRCDIIRMAHEASPDMTWYEATVDESTAAPDEVAFLERFAELIAAAEREECAKVCEEKFSDGALNIAAAIRSRST